MPYDARPWLASYPEDVPVELDAPLVPLTRLLDDAAAAFPGGVAITAGGTTFTYRRLRELVDRFAGGLASSPTTSSRRGRRSSIRGPRWRCCSTPVGRPARRKPRSSATPTSSRTPTRCACGCLKRRAGAKRH